MNEKEMSRETIRKRAVALPLAEQGEVLGDYRQASAFIEELRQNGSIIPKHIRQLTHDLTDEIAPEVAGSLPKPILRSIIARAIISGAAQALSDTGEAAVNIEEFRNVISLEEVKQPLGPIANDDAA